MIKLKKVRNSTCEDEMALFNLSTDEVMLTGNYYDDKIYEKINGFLEGLEYAKIDYELEDKNMKEIHPEDELFNKCNFYNNTYED